MGSLLVLAGALLLDALLGDPAWLYRRLPHPVVSMGRLLATLDGALNKPSGPGRRNRLRGLWALLVYLGLLTAAAVIVDQAIARLLPRPAGIALEALLVSVLLAGRGLMGHVGAVLAPLASGDLAGARDAVGHIVGRRPENLKSAGIARAAIESLAENFSDGLVAPVFWYLLFGLPGIVVYKAVNTADSQIGHLNPLHRDFGWAAARLDDAANLVPARLAAVLFALAALCLGWRGPGRALAAAWSDAGRHLSPNAGWPEAAMAGALGVSLGGPRQYGAVLTRGAWLGRGRWEATAADLRRALRLARFAWCIVIAGSWLAALLWLSG